MKLRCKEFFTKDFIICNVFLFLLIVFIACSIPKIVQTLSGQPPQDIRPVIIVDAGHGGIDGGAQTADGTLEKGINLEISLRLRDFLKSAGYTVVMIRETDISIHDSFAATVRQKKVSDLHNRLHIANEYPDGIYISIHQNKFEQSQYHGAQMFYAKNNPESQILAESIDASVKSKLQPDNTRELKQGGKNIYILWNATIPTVLAECGFLSNPEEAAKLTDSGYQSEMAYAIFSGIDQYVSRTA